MNSLRGQRRRIGAVLGLGAFVGASLLSGLGPAAAHQGGSHGAQIGEPATPVPVERPVQRSERPQLGTSVEVAPDGSLQAVFVEEGHVLLQRSVDGGLTWSQSVRVNTEPEAISADGENRPKIAFGPAGEVYVSWARRFEERFTGDVRFARAPDGLRFDAPITVHQDRSPVGHSFNSLRIVAQGVLVLWLDGRHRVPEGSAGEYRGSALYSALSVDGGKTFAPERKLADHACQCCRLALARDADGATLLMWRHVFEPNVRDHAIARLGADGGLESIERATFDGWQIDACPHHGPSLAVSADGTRHAVWFNQRDAAGRVFYGRLAGGRVEGQRPVGGERAAHADLVAHGRRIAIVWKEFDGERTHLRAELSEDDGAHFRGVELDVTDGASDQPRLLVRDEAILAVWRTAKGGLKSYRLD